MRILSKFLKCHQVKYFLTQDLENLFYIINCRCRESKKGQASAHWFIISDKLEIVPGFILTFCLIHSSKHPNYAMFMEVR